MAHVKKKKRSDLTKTTSPTGKFFFLDANKLSANLAKTSYTVFKNATNTPAYLNSIKIEDTV